ncbi:MAG: histidine kinase [Cytophagales bacterium]|nr:histidine kinase [Cytophagales bacterium]
MLSYKPGFVLLRFLIISLIAIGVLHLIRTIVEKPDDMERISILLYVIIIIAFNVASEIQIILDHILERFLPIPTKIRLRVVLHLCVGIVVLVISHKIIMSILSPEMLNETTRPGTYMGLISGLLFVYMLANSLTYTRFLEKWMESQNKIEEMKREKLRIDYNSLQDQLNPHFLFNNLSVLKSLITYDQDSALEFTENFTDVYRYVLQCREKQLVKLKEELEFIHSYIGLHKERLGTGLDVTFSIVKEDLAKEIAPLTLQLLVENAIKHNVAKRESPLQIDIRTQYGLLRISNSLQLKNSSFSTKTGLKNLVKRYEMLSSREIEISKNAGRFEVKVPLL